ncbi:MAG: DUF488 domain-containing protein [Verrucomicrobiales bacterium]|nr:DUF488 domain-containing protein [Verrucomicrobiales bacterium]
MSTTLTRPRRKSGKPTKTTVFHTLGYEQSDSDDYVRRLREHGVSVVVDVRDMPLSRKKGFSKNQLRALLEEAGIGYVHYRSLGAPKALRTELIETKSWSNYVAKYREQVLKHRKEEVDELVDLTEKETISLLCFERDPMECHRSLVAREMEKRGKDRGLAVDHIRY